MRLILIQSIRLHNPFNTLPAKVDRPEDDLQDMKEEKQNVPMQMCPCVPALWTESMLVQ